MLLRTAIATIVAVTSAGAFAGKLKVPAQYAEIQDAIDVANSGDVIEVASGVYFENLSGFRPGVTLVGKGNVVLDAHPETTPDGTGPGILIAEEGVTIKNLTIRHAKYGLDQEPAGIVAYAGTVTIEDVRIIHCGGYAINVAAPAGVVHAPRIENCTVRGFGGGVRIQADHARVRKLESAGASQIGVWIQGDDARVEKCSLATCNAAGIAILGNDGVVRKNKVEGKGPGPDGYSWLDSQVGIVTEGDRNLIESNQVAHTDIGIAARGIQPHLEKNHVDRCVYQALLLSEVKGGHASENHVLGGFQGVELSGTQTFVLYQNDVEACGYGFHLSNSFANATTGNLFLDNTARRCFNDGFHVFASGNTFELNRAEDNEVDGFDVQLGSGNSFEGNLAKNNLGEGFENNGMATTYTNNIAKGNRAAFANSGAVTTFQSNQPNTIVEPTVD